MTGKVLKLECFVNRALIGDANANQEITVIVDLFLQVIQDQKGWVTRIANNTGAGPGVNTGRAFWDQPNPALSPFWSYWRWNESARRPHASYFLWCGSTTSPNAGVSAPGLINGAVTTNVQGLGLAWAGKLNASNVAVNPWGGVDATTKGNPVFSSAGVGEKLYLLPISNGPGGTHAASRQNMAGIQTGAIYSGTGYRVQCIADEDNIVILIGRDAPAQSSAAFMLCTMTPGAGVVLDFPVFMCTVYGTSTTMVLPADNGRIGELDGGVANGEHNGGAVTPTGTVAATTMSNYNLLIDPGRQPNPNVTGDTAYDTQQVVVSVSGGGLLGVLDRPIVEATAAALAWGSPLNGAQQCVLDGSTADRARMLWAWDGVTPAGSGTNRNGVLTVT